MPEKSYLFIVKYLVVALELFELNIATMQVSLLQTLFFFPPKEIRIH